MKNKKIIPSQERSNSDIRKKRYVDWIEYVNFLDSLSKRIKDSKKKFDYVYGIPRGGMIPAVYLSHKLNIKLSETDIIVERKDLKILIVDDIIDSGKTLEIYKSFSNVFTATIFKHSKCKFAPSFYVEENDRWIVFPYEKD